MKWLCRRCLRRAWSGLWVGGIVGLAWYNLMATVPYSNQEKNEPTNQPWQGATNYYNQLLRGEWFATTDLNQWGNQQVNNNNNNDEQEKDDPNVVTARDPTHTACEHSNGVYHISIADVEGGVGTALLQLVLVQILYAESHNYTPWVHLRPGVSRVIEDATVHAATTITTRLTVAAEPTMVSRRTGRHRRDVTPGPILLLPNNHTNATNTNNYKKPTTRTLEFAGTGIWGHYFEPVSDFSPGDRSCENKLYATIPLEDMYLIIPGLHGYDATHAVRAWRYDYLPPYVAKPHQSLYTWLEPQRRRAAAVMAKSIRFRPYLHRRADSVNPDCSSGTTTTTTRTCLGLHIRHSDKAAGRQLIPVADFLPFCEQFILQAGNEAAERQSGQSSNENNNKNHSPSNLQIYVATDSAAVLHEIYTTWPPHVLSILRTAADLVRSNDSTAVFNMANHHQTNQDVLVEILALSQCQFLIHGHSAVSEAAIWTNIKLHETSVNLEDADHLNVTQFGRLVGMAMDPKSSKLKWPRPVYFEDQWPPEQSVPHSLERHPTDHACDEFDGVLQISTVGRHAQTATAFFHDVLNQLIFAENHNLVPWIHISSNTLIFDGKVHNNSQPATAFQMFRGAVPLMEGAREQSQFTSPPGNGIWTTYFEPVSDFVPGDKSCDWKPLFELNERDLESIRITQQSIRFQAVMRTHEAHEITNKYVRFRSFLRQRADEVNYNTGSAKFLCLGVHIKLRHVDGKRQGKISADTFLPYLDAFARAGGARIYIVTDTQRPLQYMTKNFPKQITRLLRSQGDHIVRSPVGGRGEWSRFELDEHHRVNSEILVDILALSHSNFLIHVPSNLSQAAINLNPSLRNYSVNLDDPKRMSPTEFEDLVKSFTGVNETDVNDTEFWTSTQQIGYPQQQFNKPRVIRSTPTTRSCRNNAIVYLAQKNHSSYNRNSFSNLLLSFDLLNQNYLSINEHFRNTAIFVFHTGDFNMTDLNLMEDHLGVVPGSASVALHLIDLSETKYWARPKSNANDKPESWYAFPLFSEGYRRMMHWFAIDLWDFFADWNAAVQCEYRYIWRLDEDSYIRSPIRYDVFEYMTTNQYIYGFRMCAYEMKVTKPMSTMWLKSHQHFEPHRQLDLDMCGFYNNFFVADLHFFRSKKVAQFLAFIDRKGHIYRRRLGDLMIHSMAVYWFAAPERIHRFLDFTYEHSTINQTNGCVQWGGIQAGYDDPFAAETISHFNETMVIERGCDSVRWSILREEDLSPSYAHVPDGRKGRLFLQTITAGNVELPEGKGLLSG